MLVAVTDQNDHAPVFPRTLHETQITEEDDRHLPKVILTVSDEELREKGKDKGKQTEGETQKRREIRTGEGEGRGKKNTNR